MLGLIFNSDSGEYNHPQFSMFPGTCIILEDVQEVERILEDFPGLFMRMDESACKFLVETKDLRVGEVYPYNVAEGVAVVAAPDEAEVPTEDASEDEADDKPKRGRRPKSEE